MKNKLEQIAKQQTMSMLWTACQKISITKNQKVYILLRL